MGITGWQESQAGLWFGQPVIQLAESQAGLNHRLVGITGWQESQAGGNHRLVGITGWWESQAGRNHRLVGITGWWESQARIKGITD